MKMKKAIKSKNAMETDAKLQKLLAARPVYDDVSGYTQISAVQEVLERGDYVDFWWAFKYCQQTQRLSAVIHILRHKTGLPIVEWQPTEFGGSVYSLYEYAPEEVKKQWKKLEGMSKEEIMSYDFNRARKDISAQMEGQMTIADCLG